MANATKHWTKPAGRGGYGFTLVNRCGGTLGFAPLHKAQAKLSDTEWERIRLHKSITTRNAHMRGKVTLARVSLQEKPNE